MSAIPFVLPVTGAYEAIALSAKQPVVSSIDWGGVATGAIDAASKAWDIYNAAQQQKQAADALALQKQALALQQQQAQQQAAEAAALAAALRNTASSAGVPSSQLPPADNTETIIYGLGGLAALLVLLKAMKVI